MTSTKPDPGTITPSAFNQLLKLYPTVQLAAYRAKISNDKKLATAQKDHDWRYDELPALLAGRSSKSSSAYLEKDEMVRLTQWKIVHGQHRPFLPGMVKKNEPERVEVVTRSAFKIQANASYTSDDLPESLDKALREAAQLHGVGPATATLVCSICDPTNVSFFEDELAAWLCPQVVKLKYSWTEYKMLFNEVMKLRSRLGMEHKAVEVEKVGFVLGHVDLLDEEQREGLVKAGETEITDGQNEAKSKASESIAGKTKPSTTKRKAKPEEDTLAKKDTKPRAKRSRGTES